MRASTLGLATVAALLLGAVAAHTVQPVQRRITLNHHTFTLPPGFTIELAAGPPLIERPITADFDELGNLYVTESSGTNENVQEQLKKKPHRVLRLTDSDDDGKYDQRTVFADGMMFPEGSLWHNGSLYVAAPPSIWKLTDTDGDGVADERVEWFQGKTLTGCANDLHGPYLGLDGMIYWCKGAFAKQTYTPPPPPFKGGENPISSPSNGGVKPVVSPPLEGGVGGVSRVPSKPAPPTSSAAAPMVAASNT